MADIEEKTSAPGDIDNAGAGGGDGANSGGANSGGAGSGDAQASVPARAKVKKSYQIDKLFRAMEKMGGSDLHLKANSPPRVRVRGGLKTMSVGALSDSRIERMIRDILTPEKEAQFDRNGAIDFAHQAEGGARFRVNAYRQSGMTSMAARRISSEIMDYKQLHLPPSLDSIAQHHQGLILVSGITGSGKSTTIAAMIEQINKTRSAHIVTIEDPIEFQYTDKKAFINQREIGLDVKDFHDALKYLMRQDPDVVLIGEMRDEETFSAALHAAESGHLVFGTVHASGTAGTITRILELFPERSRALVRNSLVFNLQAIICQKLLKTIRPDVPRVPCVEICILNATVRKLLADGRDSDIPSVVKSSYGEGMIDFNESLRQLVEEEYINQAIAYAAAPNPEELKMKLKGINIGGGGLIG